MLLGVVMKLAIEQRDSKELFVPNKTQIAQLVGNNLLIQYVSVIVSYK